MGVHGEDRENTWELMKSFLKKNKDRAHRQRNDCCPSNSRSKRKFTTDHCESVEYVGEIQNYDNAGYCESKGKIPDKQIM